MNWMNCKCGWRPKGAFASSRLATAHDIRGRKFHRIAAWIFVVISVHLAPLVGAAEATELDAARSLYDLGKFTEARDVLEKLAASDPASAEVNFHLGEIALRQNDLQKAVALLEKTVAAAPTVSRYHHRLGDAYGRMAQQASIFSALGWAKKCLRAFQRAVELDPTNVDARYSLFTFYRGAPAIIGGGEDKAADEAATLKRLDPDRGRIAFAALYVAQKKYDAARAELAEIRPFDLAMMRSDRVFLSDVEWTSAKVGWGEPARNHAWFDEKSHQGVVLLVHGRLYSKGLYAHSPSRYTFALEGKWGVFTATVGLRDAAHQQGSAVFTVKGDGRELFRSSTLRVDASQQVKIDIAGINELELVAEPGESHNHSSWAIWADPQVRR
jgi:tetratricopeptide (TPR) repeat protein